MKIKKPVPSASPATPASGGAVISDRFKLDPSAGKKPGASTSKTSVTIGLVGGVLSLAVSGMLVYMLFQHWKALMPA